MLQGQQDIFSYLHKQLEKMDSARFTCPEHCNAESLEDMLASCEGPISLVIDEIDEANVLWTIPRGDLLVLLQIFRQIKHAQIFNRKQGIAGMILIGTEDLPWVLRVDEPQISPLNAVS